MKVLSITAKLEGPHAAGWCSYAPQLSESPDIEIFCGGLNSKAADAAALWRQGHLLHFGFDLAPSEMSAQGRALLVNSIAYIARFTRDRALLEARSPFAGLAARSRASLKSWLEQGENHRVLVEGALEPSLVKSLGFGSAAEYLAWLERESRWLHPNQEQRLCIDAEAKALGIEFDQPGFFDAVLEKLADPATAEAALALLRRYVPEGPRDESSAAAWRSWIEPRREALYFSEWGGYRWYVDRLAFEAGLPSAKLRGPERSDDALERRRASGGARGAAPRR